MKDYIESRWQCLYDDVIHSSNSSTKTNTSISTATLLPRIDDIIIGLYSGGFFF